MLSRCIVSGTRTWVDMRLILEVVRVPTRAALAVILLPLDEVASAVVLVVVVVGRAVEAVSPCGVSARRVNHSAMTQSKVHNARQDEQT